MSCGQVRRSASFVDHSGIVGRHVGDGVVAFFPVVVRFGLHWGASVFIGNISTAARSEVTALGVEVNEAARIEACGTGGRILASKPLVERLTVDDGAAIGIDPDRLGYTQLADLPTATEKARRDAPAIAVCEL